MTDTSPRCLTGRLLTGGALLLFVTSFAAVAGPLRAQGGTLPSPESVFGHRIGADFRLIDYGQSIDYFRRLAAASDRIRLLEVGKTSQGRPWTIALISSPANLADVERLRGIAQRLAHPTGLSAVEARALAREGKVFVDISGGLHASEIAGSQHTMQLAYDLLSGDDARTRAILESTVLVLWPSINPDGQDIVVQWYRKNVGTSYEVAPLDSLYQRYIGHDNNRDAYMLNQVESRVVARTWRHWEPQVIYVQHQTAPFPTRIWLPPFAEPVTPRVPPLMAREVNTIGMTIAQALETNGQVGATHMGKGFDAWYPGYIDYLPMLQNIAAFWTETALYSYATPKFYTIDDFPAEYRDLRAQSLYTSPWRGGWWRLRDAVEYMETGSLATLDYAAKYREEILWNRYRAGRDAIARYRAEPPYAYVVPQTQRDPGAAVALLQRLAFNGVRVAALAREAELGGQRYPAGTWVIPMDQEFAEVVRQLFDRQQYPDLRDGPEGAPEPPYDAAGWTLPYLTDVKVVEIRAPLAPAAAAAVVPVAGRPTGLGAPDAPFTTDPTAAGIVAPPARIVGTGPSLRVDPAQNDAFRLVNRALTAGGTVRLRDGRYVVSGIAGGTLEGWARELGLQAERTADAAGTPVGSRLALYQPSAPSMDAGWTEWLLDRHEFRYAQIGNADLRAGDLRARFDVILIASDRAATLRDGYVPGRVPPAIEGGIGDEGIRALDAFVRAGGTVVAMNAAATFAIDALHLPVRNVVRGLPAAQFFASGSILQVTTDTTHAVMAGMPELAKVFFDQSPAFAPAEGFVGTTVARYDRVGSPLLSGYLLGESHLQGAAAALDVAVGRGHVILLGFRPQWRGQTIGTFRVLLNAALYAPPPVRRPSSE